jgi:hypothetical protein
MWRVYPGAQGYPGFLATQTQTKGILQVYMDGHPYYSYLCTYDLYSSGA